MATTQYTNPLALVAFNIAPHYVETGDIRELIQLTDDELVEIACSRGDVSALALEFMERLDQAKDYIADLEEQLENLSRDNAVLRRHVATS